VSAARPGTTASATARREGAAIAVDSPVTGAQRLDTTSVTATATWTAPRISRATARVALDSSPATAAYAPSARPRLAGFDVVGPAAERRLTPAAGPLAPASLAPASASAATTATDAHAARPAAAQRAAAEPTPAPRDLLADALDGVGSAAASAASGGAGAPAVLLLLSLATALLALGARLAPALARAPAAPYLGRLAPPG
jgi:hypothetical protein